MEGVVEQKSPETPDEKTPAAAPGEACGKPTLYQDNPPCFLPKGHDGMCQAEAYWCAEHSAPRFGGVCVACVKVTVGSLAWDVDELRDDYNRLQERFGEVRERLADAVGDGSQQHGRADSARDRVQKLMDEVAARRRMDGWAPVKLLFSRRMYLAVWQGLLPGMSVAASVLNQLDEVERERQADIRVEHENAKSLVESVSVLWRSHFRKGGRNGEES